MRYCVTDHDKKVRVNRLLMALRRSNGEADIYTLEEATGIAFKTLYRLLHKLKKEGVVTNRRVSKRHVWSLK